MKKWYDGGLISCVRTRDPHLHGDKGRIVLDICCLLSCILSRWETARMVAVARVFPSVEGESSSASGCPQGVAMLSEEGR